MKHSLTLFLSFLLVLRDSPLLRVTEISQTNKNKNKKEQQGSIINEANAKGWISRLYTFFFFYTYDGLNNSKDFKVHDSNSLKVKELKIFKLKKEIKITLPHYTATQYPKRQSTNSSCWLFRCRQSTTAPDLWVHFEILCKVRQL